MHDFRLETFRIQLPSKVTSMLGGALTHRCLSEPDGCVIRLAPDLQMFTFVGEIWTAACNRSNIPTEIRFGSFAPE